MTIDDESSIYVGGIPFDSTEDSVRRVFALYGSIVAVKIINDSNARGKCYGFITFTNPRSAIDAINDMNGKTVDGSIVRVNEVRSRDRRPNFSRERPTIERGTNWSRGRYQERDRNRAEDRYRDHYDDRSREREKSRERGRLWNRSQDREKGYDRAYDNERSRGHISNAGQDQNRGLENNELQHNSNNEKVRDRDNGLNLELERDVEVSNDHRSTVTTNKDQQSRKYNGSTTIDRQSREFSSDSTSEYEHQGHERMQELTKWREDLEREISDMKELIGEKQQLILDLQKKSKKLEDALISAKKMASQRQSQLSLFCKGYLKVVDYAEKLKNSEEGLKSHVDSAMRGSDMGEDGGGMDY